MEDNFLGIFNLYVDASKIFEKAATIDLIPIKVQEHLQVGFDSVMIEIKFLFVVTKCRYQRDRYWV